MKTEQRKCCCGGLPALWWWLLALLGTGLLYLGMIANKQRPIEQDLTERSTTVLEQSGYDWVKPVVNQRGRDVYLSGVAPDETSRQTAIRNVQNLYGVRTVDAAGLKVAGDPMVPPPPVASSTTAATTGTLAVGTASGLIAAGTSDANSDTTASMDTTTSTPTDATTTTVTSSMTDTPESTLAAGVPETSTEPEPTTQATVPTTTVQGNVNSSTSTEATSTTAAPATATTTAEAPTTNTTNTSTPEENTVVTAPAPAAEPAPSATSASTPSSTTNTTQALSPTTGKPASPEASASTPSSTTNTAQVLSPTTATPAVTPDPEPVVVLDDKQQTCQNRFSQEVKDTTIQFSVNKAVITPGSYPLLDTLATIAKECAGTLGNLKVEVGGHTDSDGNDKYNQQLSEQRAGAVKQYLVKKGVATTLLTVKGYGESRPVASNLTAEGRAQNRRIEFKLK